MSETRETPGAASAGAGGERKTSSAEDAGEEYAEVSPQECQVDPFPASPSNPRGASTRPAGRAVPVRTDDLVQDRVLVPPRAPGEQFHLCVAGFPGGPRAGQRRKAVLIILGGFEFFKISRPGPPRRPADRPAAPPGSRTTCSRTLVDPPQEDDLPLPLPHRHVEVSRVRARRHDVGQLVEVGAKRTLGRTGESWRCSATAQAMLSPS